jgi:hypothetical protein
MHDVGVWRCGWAVMRDGIGDNRELAKETAPSMPPHFVQL